MPSLLPPDPTLLLSHCLGLPVPLPGRSPRPKAILGPSSLPSWTLRALCPPLAQGARLLWIDAGNRFNAHGLAVAARALGADPRRVLANVRLARPFNAFQLVAMVGEKVRRLPPHPLVLSDPLAPFLDDELNVRDARKVFKQFLAGLSCLPAPSLALLPPRDLPPGRRFLGALLERTDVVARLVLAEGGPSLEPVAGPKVLT